MEKISGRNKQKKLTMGKTQDKIITAAIELFNQRGVGAVRVHDIARFAGMSPGNLTYHFKTKKELIIAVFQEMKQALKDMSLLNRDFVEKSQWGETLRVYFLFQIKYRFFNRDILEIINIVPEIRESYQKQVQQIISFSTHSFSIYIEKGYFKPEAHKGLYETLVWNTLGILSSWLIQWEVLGREKVDITRGIIAVIELHYPYFTEKGMPLYHHTKKHLPELLRQDLEAGIKLKAKS